MLSGSAAYIEIDDFPNTPPGNHSTIFCDYSCLGRPSPPGHCIYTEEFFETRGTWLSLELRSNYYYNDLLPRWTDLAAGSMTWEGWFRVQQLPNESAQYNTLIGTAGEFHDSDKWSESHRRRHAGIYLNSSGQLYLTTNVGSSTGMVTASKLRNFTDGDWHHIAGIWRKTGGSQISITVYVTHLNYGEMLFRQQGGYIVEDNVHKCMAAVGGYALEDVLQIYFDASTGAGPGKVFIVGFTAVFNGDRIMKERYMTTTTLVPCIEDTIHIGLDPILEAPMILREAEFDDYTDLMTSNGVFANKALPTMIEAGSASLWLDGYPGEGNIDIVPDHFLDGLDDMGMDGELVIGGGRVAHSLGIQMSRVRIWSMELSEHQMNEVRKCVVPSLPRIIGGAYPHGLQVSIPFKGDLMNGVTTAWPSEIPDKWGTGQFVIGGRCSETSCPRASTHNCPLRRQLDFFTLEECYNFSNWSFCTLMGPERSKYPHLCDFSGVEL